MTTREQILELFETHREVYFSGEELARRLEVSRAAVWKAVKALQAEGYAIDAVPNRGYSLSQRTDILSAQGIGKYLAETLPPLEFLVLARADSTNALMREQADKGVGEGRVILASEQTAGRGRTGRSFFSPGDTGVYLSLLLRPRDCAAQQAVQITTMAAVAACEAIEEVSGQPAQIKWVNDIFMRGRKVCGILTEGSFGLENGLLEYVVLGVGFNVYPPRGGFPPELRDIAGAILAAGRSDAKNRLAAAFFNRFFFYYSNAGHSGHVEQYRRRSLVIDRPVTLVSAAGEREATVLGIDDQCRLLVRYGDGTEDCCASGEIRLRM